MAVKSIYFTKRSFKFNYEFIEQTGVTGYDKEMNFENRASLASLWIKGENEYRELLRLLKKISSSILMNITLSY